MSQENSQPTTENTTQSNSLQDLESTKHRRLVPQFSLTSQNLGSDNGRGRTTTESIRKTVIRFTREQLIALRKSSGILPSMTVMTEISSVDQLDPVCFTKLEPEDVIRICSVKDAAARGRGSRVRNFQKGDDEVEGENGRDDEENGSKMNSLWDDDVKNSDSADHEINLADLAQASLKFRSDIEKMRSGADVHESKLESIPEVKDEKAQDKLTFENEEVVEIPKILPPSVNDNGFNNNLKFIFGSSLNLTPAPEFPSTSIINDAFSFPLSNTESVAANVHSPVLFPSHSSVESFQLKVEWYYTDPQKQIQGPFSQENMRLWNEAGYFGNDLPIKLHGWSKFHLFQEVFPEPKLAFYGVPKEPVPVSLSLSDIMMFKDSGLASKTLEKNVFSNEREKIGTNVDRLEFSDKSTRLVDNSHVKSSELSHNLSKESPKTFDTKTTNAKTDFAKQLLGISGPKSSNTVKEENFEPAALENTSKVNEIAEKPSKLFKGWTEDSVPKSSVSLKQIQQEELKKSEMAPCQNVVTNATTNSSTSTNANTTRSVQLKSLLGMKVSEDKSNKAWGSTQVELPVAGTTTSLMDIMNEELNKQQKYVSQEKASASSWAAKAKPSMEHYNNATLPSNVSAVQMKNATEHSSSPKSSSSASDSRTAFSQSKSDFGGKQMSKEMSDWCTAQLKKINGSNDLTLLQFCMALKSPVDIREYFSQYLGSSPQIANFATEFIKFKEGKKVEALVPVQIHDNLNTGKKKRTSAK